VRGSGVVLLAPADGAAAVWDALVAAGATACGMRALEARRVETGVPRIGVDMDGTTLALELPVEDLISTSKGCYLGQEVVARGTARGQVQRRLVGVRFEGAEPAPGAPLRDGGRDVGRVTSRSSGASTGRPGAWSRSTTASRASRSSRSPEASSIVDASVASLRTARL
jgi:folate-binding protein YgfZ